jgi:hypothetical protein
VHLIDGIAIFAAGPGAGVVNAGDSCTSSPANPEISEATLNGLKAVRDASACQRRLGLIRFFRQLKKGGYDGQDVEGAKAAA